MPAAAALCRPVAALRWMLVATACVLLAVAACTGPDGGLGRPGGVGHNALGRRLGAGPEPTQTIHATATPAPGSSPNFVFVLTDDLSMNLISQMPQVLQMQRDGTTLSHYYVVDSLCCPSRTAILTGEYPHNSGVLTNIGKVGGYPAFQRHRDEEKTFAVALQRAGYRTGFFGKYLNGYSPRYPEPPGWNDWAATAYGYNEFGYRLNVNGVVKKYGAAPADYLTDVISGMGARFIATSAAQRKPFMLELSTFAPHMPYVPAPRDAHAFPDLQYPRTPAYNTFPTHPPAWLTPHRPPLSPRIQATMAAQYRLRVRDDLAVDDLIANVKGALQKAGVADNTYVVFSSDNGYHMGEYRLYSGKQTAYDTDIHVPLIVTGPGVPAGATAPQMAASVDLAPTFEQLGGADESPDVDGVSLAALWHGEPTADWQRGVLVEHYGPNHIRTDPDYGSFASGDPPSYQAIRTATALYVRYVDGEREYYNTASDPYELHNIARDGVPADLVRALDHMRDCRGAAQCQAAARAV